MGLPVTLIWTRPSPQCVRTARRDKTLRGCAIRPPKEDNIMHTRAPKCDEVISVQTYQIWTNQYVMNNYIILLIMREWFCLNALWKVKSSHEKKFMRKRKSCSLKIKISKVLLCFKDKESDENVLFWSKGSLSWVLEGAGFSFKSIDPKLAIWCLVLWYCVF